MTTTSNQALFTKDQAAEFIGATRRFLETKISAGELAVIKLSKKLVRIRRTELERWLEEHTVHAKVSGPQNSSSH